MTDQNKLSNRRQFRAEKENGCAPQDRKIRIPYPNKSYVDIIALVRSLQRTAGQVDCFRSGNADCDIVNCDWRAYCLTGSAGKTTEKE